MFGQRLSRIMRERGVTDSQLGQRIGLHSTTIWRYRRSREAPKSGRTEQIALALRCNPEWLRTGLGMKDSTWDKRSEQTLVKLYRSLPADVREVVDRFLDELGDQKGL